MTSLTPIATALPIQRSATDARVVAGAARPELVAAPRGDRPQQDPGIAARLEAKVGDGSLDAGQAESLRQLIDRPAGSSNGSLMRTASEQLDQFDRVLEKLRANMGAGATYGRTSAAPSGVMVDRLA